MTTTTLTPWHVGHIGEAQYRSETVFDPNHGLVATICMTGPVGEADAKIMSAAPELLTALQVALLHIERMTYEAGRTGTEAEKHGTKALPPSAKDLALIRTAIEKATT